MAPRNSEVVELSVKSLSVALDILEAVALADGEIGVTELSAMLGLTKATAFRHLRSLVERGYVAQNPTTSRYRLGIKVHLLSRAGSGGHGLLATAEPIMRELRETTGQSVVLSVVEPKCVRVATAMLGKSNFEIGVRAGSELEFHASAQGKVALGFSRKPLLAGLKRRGLRQLSDRTITNWNALMSEIAQVRKQGWATAPDEVVLGLNAVAAPIFDGSSDCIGAIAIVGSIQFIKRPPDAGQVAAVKHAAAVISASLGFGLHAAFAGD